MNWKYHDGGRKAAGYAGIAAGDCFTRAIAIADRQLYQQVYDLVNSYGQRERVTRGRKKAGKSSAGTGVYKETARRILTDLGWKWTPTMQVGQGCKVHLRSDELPSGRLIVQVSKHYVAVVNGIIYDTHDCSRGGTRCVYGFWQKGEAA